MDRSPAAATPDAKIAFYRGRTGGRGTYPAYARLGLAYLEKARESGQAKHHSAALRYLRRSLSYQRNFEALWGMAAGLSAQHEFREALTHAKEAVEAMPSSLEARGVLFDIRLALGEVREAQTVLDSMFEEEPGFAAFSRLAALREYRGNHTGAVEALIQARDCAAAAGLPASVRAWVEVRLGSVRLAQCEVLEARAAYDRALWMAPGYFFAKEHLAEWHAAQDHWEEAGRLFHELSKVRPEPQYRLALAQAYSRQGKTKAAHREEQKALRELRRAAREGASAAFRPLTLWLLEIASHDTWAEAVRWAERDWEIRRDALAADTLAWAYCCNGRCAEGLRLSQEALQSGTCDPAVLLHSGLIRLRSGLVSDGRRLVEQALACPQAFGPLERALAIRARAELGALSGTAIQHGRKSDGDVIQDIPATSGR